jgi:putative N6-adenine-specific DNA methylase
VHRVSEFKLVATTAMGLESIVADEVKALGFETTSDNGKIYFTGDETAIAKTNIWCRVADRIRIIV